VPNCMPLFVFLIMTSVFISGCVSELRAKPDDLMSTKSYNSGHTLTKPITIAVSDFSLKTGKPDNVIGEAKTGIFNSPIPITYGQPATTLISGQIKKGLSGMGFKIAAPEDAEFILDGTIESLWVEEYATGFSMEYAKANARYDVVLKDKNGKVLWGTSVESYKNSNKSMDATYDDLPTLKAACEDSISKLFEDPSFWGTILR